MGFLSILKIHLPIIVDIKKTNLYFSRAWSLSLEPDLLLNSECDGRYSPGLKGVRDLFLYLSSSRSLDRGLPLYNLLSLSLSKLLSFCLSETPPRSFSVLFLSLSMFLFLKFSLSAILRLSLSAVLLRDLVRLRLLGGVAERDRPYVTESRGWRVSGLSASVDTKRSSGLTSMSSRSKMHLGLLTSSENGRSDLILSW